jgi:hypothetical protein
MSLAPDCHLGCASRDDCQAVCGSNPPWLAAMSTDDLYPLLDFANEVQAWSFGRDGESTFGEAAAHFGVPVERINQAVVAHYWMFTPDAGAPLADRRIDHEGE